MRYIVLSLLMPDVCLAQFSTYQQIPQEHNNSDFTDGWYIDGCSLLDFRGEILRRSIVSKFQLRYLQTLLPVLPFH